MLDTVFVKSYPAPPIDRKEILRYAGCKGEADERTESLLNACIKESETVFSYRVCYRVTKAETLVETLGGESAGKLFNRKLCGAEYAATFAATVGLGIDRAVLRETAVSPAKAVMLQALGAERIESLCDAFCDDLAREWKERGFLTGARFSAGYGDFPLAAQREMFAFLDCHRKIGLTLNESLLMTPTKSVTAIVPIGKTQERERQGCAACDKVDCTARKSDGV